MNGAQGGIRFSVTEKKKKNTHVAKASETAKPIAKIGKGGVPILENGLTVYQDRVIEAAHETGFKNVAKLCKFAKVPIRNFYRWMKESPTFLKAWEDSWGRAVGMNLPAVIEAVAKRAIATGDPQAARVLLELKGLANKRVLEIDKLSDDELNARILRLTKEAGIGEAPRGGSAPEKGTSEAGPEVPQRGSLN